MMDFISSGSSFMFLMPVFMQLFIYLAGVGLIMFAVWLFKNESKVVVFKWSIGFFFVGLLGAVLTLWYMSNQAGTIY